jgi:sugar phosphate isomerase/epimerase
MKLLVYRNLWGVTGDRAVAVGKIAAAGYHGIETVLPDVARCRELKPLLRRHRLDYRGVIWTRGRSVSDHLASFRAQLARLLRMDPSGFTVIGGHDCWNEDETCRYYEEVLRIEARIGLPVAHELHRSTCLFHPVPTRRIITQFPQLKLVCDFSHWVVSSESMLDDQLDLVRLCGRQAVHIHARVGHEESPQVADPRAPEARAYCEAFERWWRIVWEEQLRRGLAATMLCPEFGAPPYQQTLPYTGMPVADLWEICDWQAIRQRKLFSEWRDRRPGSSNKAPRIAKSN